MKSKDDVLKIASLAHLQISDNEADGYARDLGSILAYMQLLNSVDVSKVDAMTHVHGQTNVMRDDEVKPSMPIEDIFMNLPDRNGRFIRVPLIKDHND